MNVQLLIDDIVRQTTVLIAQLSTAAGLRAPLSHIADQVFLELARELASQGVRRKVVADMFGMALRSYQAKLQRLNDPDSRNAATLWQDLYADLSNASATRAELESRYRTHSARQIAATLRDMVQSGLAYASGRGRQTLFGLTSDADRQHLSVTDEQRVLLDLGWYLVASGAASTRDDLAHELRCDRARALAVIDELVRGGRLLQTGEALTAKRLELKEAGWETSVMDHFRAVTTAIAAKVSHPVAADGDRVGGGTRSFLIHTEHPFAHEVYALLQETRQRAHEVWRRVADYNDTTKPPADADRVTFYFGQNVVRGDDDGAASNRTEGFEVEDDV